MFLDPAFLERELSVCEGAKLAVSATATEMLVMWDPVTKSETLSSWTLNPKSSTINPIKLDFKP